MRFAVLSLSRALRRSVWWVLPAALAVSACSTLNDATQRLSSLGGLVTPYRIDIQQGNVIVREQVQALQPGMTREQVQAILGTPLAASIFHAHRWDYVFTYQRQGQPVQRRVVTVFFDGERLARVQADELPTEEEFVASLAVRRPPARAVTLEASEEQLRAAETKGGATAAVPPAPAAAPVPPAAPSYPPLEPR